MPLENVHDIDGLLPGVFGCGDLGLQSVPYFLRNHSIPTGAAGFNLRFSKLKTRNSKLEAHRSISGKIKSMEPMMAIRSEIRWPSAIRGRAWTWAKPGERKRRR